ncbi:uncharacterized protein J4E78_001261 [Alternaria triticimaculans]|uniref:uncharacterized protein n=1 Tax=Alternaria triticimaculans TaxID=297637 RepID=UPI0020C32975|nr:uncharacterized protein J4E78_001261 [Alternaria triticimaculans]KAI4672759.1 hypothetical protein J4E78_001261 [Alternaria triticimaculans]
MALAFAKLSFLCLYLNLSPARGFRAGVHFTIFVVVGSCVGIVISLLAACKPFAKNIDVTITEGQCLNKAALYIATGVLNIITDIMVIILPIPMVLRLQMSRERKIMVIGIFSVGSILIEASLIIITGSLLTLRLFLRHVAPSLVGSSEATRPSGTQQDFGFELQEHGMLDPYDVEDGASEREILGKQYDNGDKMRSSRSSEHEGCHKQQVLGSDNKP